MPVDLLADSLVERLRSNNLHAFEHLLTDPLAPLALEYNDGLVFHLACDNTNIGFLRATLPHTLPKYIGQKLNYAVVSRDIELFEILIGSRADIFDCIHHKTLYVLVQRSLDVRKTPNPQRNVEHEMLGVFLNGAPEHVIHIQRQEMHTSNASDAAMAVVEGVLAQRQKERLEHEIEDHGQVGRSRKM